MLDAESPQPRPDEQPAEAGADDRDVDLVGDGVAGEVRVGPRVVAEPTEGPAISTYWEMPSGRRRRWRSRAYLSRSASGQMSCRRPQPRSTAPALLPYATAEYWTNFANQATSTAGNCSDFRCDIVICRAWTRYGCDAS